MGLINETNAQYYAGQQAFLAGDYSNSKFPCTFDTDLLLTVAGVSNTNFEVYVNNSILLTSEYNLEALNIVAVTKTLTSTDIVVVKLKL